MNEPIKIFNEETLEESLKYWVSKLFLNNWTIKAKLVPLGELSLPDTVGNNTMVFENKSSLITIGIIPIEDREKYIVKLYDECTLVHELLHCKYNFIEGTGSFSQVYYDALEHQQLEELAKSLIMVKYNLPFEWFKN